MALGPATGMGYVTLAVLFFVIMAAALLALTALHFGEKKQAQRLLKVTIPEDLDYDGLLDDLLGRYTRGWTLERVKTTNMGTLYELHYLITLEDDMASKPFLDAIRCRNGNLPVVCCRVSTNGDTL